MKPLWLLAVGSVATALIIPDEGTVTSAFKSSHRLKELETPKLEDGSVGFLDSDYFENILRWTAAGSKDGLMEEMKADLPEHLASILDTLTDVPLRKQPDFTNIGEQTDGHDGGDKELTVYQIISQNEHTKVFAKILSEFDDLVDKLNSTDSSYTVFVPGDGAFKRFHHHPTPPKKFLKAFLEYHIVNKSLPIEEIFKSKTIPTYLHQEELGPYPQRISTQLGLRGISLNFMAHFIRRNIGAKNGLIHAIDHFLIPPFLASDTLNFLSSQFGSFEFGLAKTGLFKEINKTSTHTGATIFAPSNGAFMKLPTPVNGFLFSRWGEKYLKALLKYHIVFDHTLYSDAYNKAKHEKSIEETTHIDLPTLLEDHHLSIDIAHVNRFYSIKVNGFSTVAVPDVVVKDGVIQVVNDILIPPRKPGGKPPHPPSDGTRPGDATEVDVAGLTVDELKERLDPFLE